MVRLNSGAAIDRLETTRTILPPISEVFWQQPTETSVEISKLVNNDKKHTTKNYPQQSHARVKAES